MLAVRIIACTIHFRVAALFAKLLQRLPAHAQMIFHLRHAGPAAVPFLFELALADFEAQFFAAEAFELLREFFALLGERGSFIRNRGFLLAKRGSRADRVPRAPLANARQALRRRKAAH